MARRGRDGFGEERRSWRASPGGSLAVGSSARAGTEDDIKALFTRFAAAQKAHDVTAVGEMVLDAPNFLWITRGTAVWGRTETLKRFTALYAGTWQLEPEMSELKVIVARADTAQLFVPILFRISPAGQPATATRFLMNQTFVKMAAGWKLASILPIPAPAP